MPAHDEIEGGWTDLKVKVREAWTRLGEDDLRDFHGSLQQFVGWIQQQTGQTSAEVERALAELDQRIRPMLQQFSESARERCAQAVVASGEAAGRLREEVEARHAQAERVVRGRPIESVAVAFGAGLVAGVVVALVLRSK